MTPHKALQNASVICKGLCCKNVLGGGGVLDDHMSFINMLSCPPKQVNPLRLADKYGPLSV